MSVFFTASLNFYFKAFEEEEQNELKNGFYIHS